MPDVTPSTIAAAADPMLLRRVMIIDDEPLNIKIARKYLQIAGYSNFITTSDAAGAMQMVRREEPDVILLDVMMPQVSGLEILQAIRADRAIAHLPVLILTASTDAETRRNALELGATDFLAKPVEPSELVPRVRNALTVKAHHDHLKHYSQTLEHEVRQRTAEVEASRIHVVHALARAAEYRDDDTGRHVIRVGRYAGVIARDLGFEEERIAMLEMAAQLHDVGKIGIPDAILLKPGKLDEAEMTEMKRHCEYGWTIINPPEGAASPLLRMAAEIAMTHHEKWDGSGYPRGLRGEDISLEGRITAAADVFDALSSKRPYKDAFPPDKCINILDDGKGRHFDAAVVTALLRRLGDITQIQSTFADAA
jgi:putative two-component system response regulator